MPYRLIKQEACARRGEFITPHGTAQTPAFMNVATTAAIRGGLGAADLAALGCQIMLCNTYHLHLRPGEDIVRGLGGLRGFTGWSGPTLTDSGGFQVFSLAALRKISEAGVRFSSHIDGRRLFMGPEESMRIQSALGSTVAMAFDECVENPAAYEYARLSCGRTTRWLVRCRDEMARLRTLPETLNKEQMLFGINQGCTFDDLRAQHMQEIAQLDLDGYAIGGLAVGEPAEEMYRMISAVEPHMPADKIRYLMGVGTPANILEAVSLGVDLFDCVMPSRNARHGHVFTWEGVRNLNNMKYKSDPAPIEEGCGCPACASGRSRAYVRHLLKADEMLGMRLAVGHNLWFYNQLMARIRDELDKGTFAEFKASVQERVATRI
ncbi:MAG: tRNA guanosine(34) transglycosylase Tgt [Oscillospiraceae bacterium]|jgi:queuine tRNA-ribosyltransferase|nr:tRNA guanosine(34) transglycosylase Tgt [Oscillospiraceae bacterium]